MSRDERPERPERPEPDAPDVIALGEANETLRYTREALALSERRVAEAEQMLRDAQLDVRHRTARLAAAVKTREALDTALADGGTNAISTESITPSTIRADGIVVASPVAATILRLEQVLDALNEQDAAIRRLVDEEALRNHLAVAEASYYTYADANGRPLLLDLLVARANVLATLAGLAQ